MTLWVHPCAAYLATTDVKWRSVDYAARNLIKAIKQEPFRGYSDIKSVDGVTRRIQAGQQPQAIRTVAMWSEARLGELKLGPIALVPVPSSQHTKFGQDTNPTRLAMGIGATTGAQGKLVSCLRFKDAKPPAHQGGGRNQTFIEDLLDYRATKDAEQRCIVLVDDVLTTGSTLKACSSFLRAQGLKVHYAIVAGRSVWDHVNDPFDVGAEDLEDVSDFDFL